MAAPLRQPDAMALARFIRAAWKRREGMLSIGAVVERNVVASVVDAMCSGWLLLAVAPILLVTLLWALDAYRVGCKS